MTAHHQDAAPAEFDHAVASLRAVIVRPEIEITSVPAPRRLAPHGLAVEADVVVDDTDLGTGRFVFLHDPAGQDAWNGTFRIVTLTQATMEPEVEDDPCLGAVGWSWLTESLDTATAAHHSIGGTVTRVVNESYGDLAGKPASVGLQVRASWSPETSDIGEHYYAWTTFLASMSGLSPLTEGVTAITRRA